MAPADANPPSPPLDFRQRKPSLTLPHPPILFEHILKAGGTTVHDLLRERVDRHNGTSAMIGPHLTLFRREAATRLGRPYVKAQVYLAHMSEGGLARAAAGHLYWAMPGGQVDFRRSFNIGMARSPCDYLVSVWAFQSEVMLHERRYGTTHPHAQSVKRHHRRAWLCHRQRPAEQVPLQFDGRSDA